MNEAFGGVFQEMPVLVTGHTGFKGSWLSIWLHELGAQVTGYSLDVPTEPSNYCASRLGGRIEDVRADVRDLDALCQTVAACRPQVVFHLAAQPIVRASYERPVETFEVNVGGTVNVLEAIRQADSVRAAVLITSDKCYENREWLWGYRETDSLGGYDPYSASKAMAELAIASYQRSFFAPERYAEHGVAIASTRAGNVIGGGDWAADRLVSDAVRALSAGRPIRVRNPHSVRPWQYVLESLSGYLWLAARLIAEGSAFAGAWNFGPSEQRAVSVGEFIDEIVARWGAGSWEDASTADAPHEAGLLRLSWEKAANLLDWQPAYTWREAVAETVAWFKSYYASGGRADMYGTGVTQIGRYTERARAQRIAWTG